MIKIKDTQKTLFALAGQLPFPLSLVLLADASGRILDLLPNAFRYPTVAHELRKSGCLQDFFSIPKGRELQALFRKEKSRFIHFFNHRPFRMSEAPDPFYTRLPTLALALTPLGRERYYGVMTLTNTDPDYFLERSHGVIYLDGRDCLAGFNGDFYGHFQKDYPDPWAMLGLPCRRFLSHSPAEFEEALLAAHPPAPKTEEKNIYHSPENRKIDNPANPLFQIRPPIPVDTRRDFKLTVDMAHAIKAAPVFQLGGQQKSPGASPDMGGYLVGPVDSENHRIVLKRTTLPVKFSAMAASGTAHTYSLVKTGPCLRYLEGDQVMLAYGDHRFLHPAGAFLTIGFRAGACCGITGIRLSVDPEREAGPSVMMPVAGFNTPETKYFRFNRMHRIQFPSRFSEVAAYVLEDVTELHKRMKALEKANASLSKQSDADFIGGSKTTETLKDTARHIADTDGTVLIEGETGTGKDVLARFLHNHSRRRSYPFIKIDCSTLSPSLLESELFGHEKGAFTGATASRKGYLEMADKGTVFLDEIGNLSRETQAKLLHFLQDKSFVPVGGRHPVLLDVRIITASNIPLARLVEKGAFRSDLYYRLNVLPLFIPPLRERMKDLPELCAYFLEKFNQTHHRKVQGLSPEAWKTILEYGWPGNVREFRNMVERAVIFCEEPLIGPEHIHFPETAQRPPTGRVRKDRVVLGATADEIRKVLKENGGNASRAAKALGVARRTLYNKLREFDLSIADMRFR